MNYINTQTKAYPVSERDIRAANLNTSYPEPFAAPAPFAPVFAVPQPEHDPLRQSVREGVPVKSAKGQWEQVWQVESLPAEAVAQNIQRAQVAAWDGIKAKRDAAKAGGALVASVDKWFHTDDPSRIQQIGLVMMGAAIPAGLLWKTMDGSFVTMTQALAGEVFQANVVQDQASFAAAEQHRIAMEASARPDLYDYSGGWPAVFEG